MEQRTEKWYSWRRNYIGSSDAAILMGVSPWKSIYELWLSKQPDYVEEPPKFYMQRGLDLEPEALRAFELATGFLMHPVTLVSPLHTFMAASLDGMDIDNRAAVEIKAPGAIDHRLAQTGDIPKKYYPQLQHQIAVTGLDKIYYASYRPEDPIKQLYIIEVPRDDEYIAKLIEIESNFFYQHMMTGIAPENPKVQPKTIESEVWKSLSDEYKKLDFQIKEQEKRRDEVKDLLIQVAQAENSTGNGLTLTKIEKKGNIMYQNIPILKTMNLEEFRKPSTSYWQVKESVE
jgi:putative phage-type endonuclease